MEIDLPVGSNYSNSPEILRCTQHRVRAGVRLSWTDYDAEYRELGAPEKSRAKSLRCRLSGAEKDALLAQLAALIEQWVLAIETLRQQVAAQAVADVADDNLW